MATSSFPPFTAAAPPSQFGGFAFPPAATGGAFPSSAAFPSSSIAQITPSPAAPVVVAGGMMETMKKNKMGLFLVVLMIVVGVVGFMVWRARKKAQENKPNEEAVDDDAKEWQYLWQMARRPSVKEKIKSFMTASPTPPLTTSSSAAIMSIPNDPNFGS